MSHTLLRRSVVATLVVLMSLLVGSAAPAASIPVRGNNELVLTPPSFVTVAKAQEAVDGFPQDEAGMSAYFRAPFSITLATVRPVFRTIEVETSDYIIGSVPVQYYGESQDVHVYVHRDGWFLAYYPAADPAGKIVDWWVYHNSGRTTLSTKLESALSAAALPVGVTTSGVNFYDFRYPNANRLITIVDWTNGNNTDTFQVNLPHDFGYFERSWSFGSTDFGRMRLNGQTLAEGTNWITAQGTLTAVQLPTNQLNTFEVYCGWNGFSYAGLVLVYRVP